MAEEKQDMGEKLTAPADFAGPSSNRGCTDILCLLLIVAHWVAMTALGGLACTTGDYRVILNPMDISGNVCGIHFDDKEDMSDYSRLYYTNMYSVGVCVNVCPAVTDGYAAATIGAPGVYYGFSMETTEGEPNYWDKKGYMTMTSSEAVEVKVGPYTLEGACNADCAGSGTAPLDATCMLPTGDYIAEGLGCGFPVLDTYSAMNRCMLTAKAAAALETTFSVKMEESGDSEEGFITKLQGDLYASIGYILGCGFVVAMVVSFLYTFFLRIPGVLFILIWGCIASVFAMLFGIGGYGLYTHGLWTTACTVVAPETTCEEHVEYGMHTSAEESSLQYISYAFFGLAAIWFLLICFLRSRIQLALAVVKQAAKAIAAMPIIILFPVMQCIGFVIFMSVWMIFAVYLASLGKPVESGICSDGNLLSITKEICELVSGNVWVPYQNFEYDENQTYAGWYLLFCYFWSSQFIIAIGQIVIAMCVAKWYFARDKATIGNGTVIQSIKDSMYYHTGTAAFGSLLIAIIKMIRAAVAYAQKKAKQSGSKVAQAVLCAIQCYMWCMEKCMKFLNKNAYIQTAIFGKNFCMAAKAAFFLILRNIARIGACTMVSEFVIIIGKVFIMVITGGITYFALGSSDLEINSPLGPVFFVMVLSYFTASMFMNIFGMGISTILQCFIADEEMFDATSRFAESELASFIDANGAPPKAEKEDNAL